jgi:transposase
VDDRVRRPRLREVDRSVVVPEAALDDLVDPDHPARALWDYVCALDLTPLLASVRAVEGVPGRNATDPRILLALWMWALTQGVGTARALDALCRDHAVYRWLAGGVSLNYHTLAVFRSAHGDALEQFLEAHVTALLHQGVIDLACVAQDGLRTRASAGAGSFRRGPTIEACQDLVRQQLEALQRQADEPPDAVARRQQAARRRHARERAERLAQARRVAEELGAKQAERRRLHPKEAAQRNTRDKPPRASTTDPEARRMKLADGGTRPGYNVQCCTTAGTGIVVGVAVTNQGCDGGLLGPMLWQVAAAYGQQPSRALVDGGYSSRADVEAAYRRGTEVYAPLRNEAAELAAGKDPYAPKAKDGPGVAAWRARMGTAAAKALYRLRAATAEWVNAGMRQRGLYRVTVRGVRKVRAVAVLQALVHNVWQTARLLEAHRSGWTWAGILRSRPGAVDHATGTAPRWDPARKKFTSSEGRPRLARGANVNFSHYFPTREGPNVRRLPPRRNQPCLGASPSRATAPASGAARRGGDSGGPPAAPAPGRTRAPSTPAAAPGSATRSTPPRAPPAPPPAPAASPPRAAGRTPAGSTAAPPPRSAGRSPVAAAPRG